MKPASLTLLSTLLLAAFSANAADDEKPAFKLTFGTYRFVESGQAHDINLRHSGDYGTAWLGVFYSQAKDLDARQMRAGWQNTFGETLRWTPSLMLASRGYAAGSLNVEVGETWVVGAGFGRTNLRSNYNLNYDPNDAWQLTAGYRAAGGQNFNVSYTRDNRLNPDQQHLHLIAQTPLAGKERFTLDLLLKRGLVDGERIQKAGLTATYDWPRFFVRASFDPKVNFTPENQYRLSVGTRF
jgi:hypothetical protein